MATSNKLPSYADIWGAPATIKASPGFIKLMRNELAKPKRKAKKRAKRK